MEKIMHRPMSPCLGCPDRNDHCHADCDRYDDFVRRAEAYREFIHKQKIPEEYRLERLYERECRRR